MTPDKPIVSDLLPCPFCNAALVPYAETFEGGRTERHAAEELNKCGAMTCPTKDCCGGLIVVFTEEPGEVEAWNKRAPLSHRASPTGGEPVVWRVSTYLHGESGWKFTADPATAHYWADTSGTVAEPLYASPVKQPLGEVTRESVIELTPAEIQSGFDRVKFAEGLIRQLPETHDGRNSWLLNYGTGPHDWPDPKPLGYAPRAFASNPPEAPTVERSKSLTLNLSDEEIAALEKLCERQDLSRERIYRQALRLYQSTVFPVDLGPMLDPALAVDADKQKDGVGNDNSGREDREP